MREREAEIVEFFEKPECSVDFGSPTAPYAELLFHYLALPLSRAWLDHVLHVSI